MAHSSSISKRDITLSKGQEAGIIVGIVVAFLILLGIFIWRFLAHRDDFGPHAGRQASAKEKALAQARGHIRSTRPRNTETQEFNDKSGLVASNPKQRDLEEGHPSPVLEDSNSLHGTVADDQQDAIKGKERQQQVDYEIFQGHHATAAPAAHETMYPSYGAGPVAAPEDVEEPEAKQSKYKGCIAM